MQDLNKAKMRSDDRILVLKPIDGSKPQSSTGMVDTRLFKGTNTLHAIRNSQTSLWTMKYDKGGLPEPLKQTFTSFNALIMYVSRYFKDRNVEIVEVLD